MLAGLNGATPPVLGSVEASIIKYYNALNAYVTATGAIFSPLCTSITTLETNTDDLSLKLMNLKPVI